MPDLQDLISLVRGPIPEKPLVAIWSIPPGTAGMVWAAFRQSLVLPA